MKLTKDMTALRAVARAELDGIFARRLSSIMGPFASLHARKAAEAARVLDGATSILLGPEAKRRGINEKILARMVLTEADRQAEQLAALEVERQDAQAAIEAAANPIELEQILSEHR